ncbi:Variant surface glycoprotein [Trypanosoma congolense IL3000]|uniref:Variant surface glycoprotein n=1 Tax=Trypanosoma congolense (strain IL3000) TaxID=1068625 RepID=F9WE73_TRYCI|nr:Variant surface glycoprotein [Trypanosoma congolense IL3000]
MHVRTAITRTLLFLLTRLVPPSEAAEAVRNRAEFSALCWFWRIHVTADMILETTDHQHLSPESLIKHRMLVEWLEDDGNHAAWGLDARLSAALWYLNETERDTAQKMYDAFTQKRQEFAQLEKAIQQKANETRRVLETVRTRFRMAAYGHTRKDEPSERWMEEAYSRDTKRSDACTLKNTRLPGQPYAGSSLVNDLLCLCLAGRPGGGDDNAQICGAELEQKDWKFTWTDSTGFVPEGWAEKAWSIMGPACGQVQRPTDLTEKNILAASNHFESLIGTNPNPNRDKFPWVLGYSGQGQEGATRRVCSANAGRPNEAWGQCVHYANTTGGGRGGIDWLQAFYDLLPQVRQYEALQRELEGLDWKVKALSQDLEEAFEEAGFKNQAPRKPHHGLPLLVWLLL